MTCRPAAHSGTRAEKDGRAEEGPSASASRLREIVVRISAGRALRAAALGLAWAAMPSIASACPVCYGNPESPMIRGARAGVLFLGGLVYFQIMLMAGVGAFWMLRARRLRRQGGLAPNEPPPLPEP